MTPDLSVIIPVFNRGDVIRYSLESVRRASAGLEVETVVVDDGSSPPIAATLARLGFSPAIVHRQENRGLLFARLAGVERATGRHILFLDSDDLVGPEKFRAQIAAMNATGADVSYTDMAHCTLAGEYDSLQVAAEPPSPDTRDIAEFYIGVQPAPHAPLFRAGYLRSVVAGAFFPPSPLYNNVAEIWFYHNAAGRPGTVRRVPGPHTITGLHPGARLTNHWEKLAVASLAVMEAFARSAPGDAFAAKARRLVGEKAFRSWRGLPRDFSPEFCRRELDVWRRLAPASSAALGGGVFGRFTRFLGPERTGRLFRRWQARPYERVRTLSDQDVARLLAALPPP